MNVCQYEVLSRKDKAGCTGGIYIILYIIILYIIYYKWCVQYTLLYILQYKYFECSVDV